MTTKKDKLISYLKERINVQKQTIEDLKTLLIRQSERHCKEWMDKKIKK